MEALEQQKDKITIHTSLVWRKEGSMEGYTYTVSISLKDCPKDQMTQTRDAYDPEKDSYLLSKGYGRMAKTIR